MSRAEWRGMLQGLCVYIRFRKTASEKTRAPLVVFGILKLSYSSRPTDLADMRLCSHALGKLGAPVREGGQPVFAGAVQLPPGEPSLAVDIPGTGICLNDRLRA
jgi:hypothetical protein